MLNGQGNNLSGVNGLETAAVKETSPGVESGRDAAAPVQTTDAPIPPSMEQGDPDQPLQFSEESATNTTTAHKMVNGQGNRGSRDTDEPTVKTAAVEETSSSMEAGKDAALTAPIRTTDVTDVPTAEIVAAEETSLARESTRDAASSTAPIQTTDVARPPGNPLPASMKNGSEKNAKEGAMPKLTIKLSFSRKLDSEKPQDNRRHVRRSPSQPASPSPLGVDTTSSNSADTHGTPVPQSALNEASDPPEEMGNADHDDGQDGDPMVFDDMPLEALDTFSPFLNARYGKRGLDGQADFRASPSPSSSSTHSAMIRTSARAKKPTVRAIESRSQARRRNKQSATTTTNNNNNNNNNKAATESPDAGEGGESRASPAALPGDEIPSDSIMAEQGPGFEEMSKHIFDTAFQTFAPKFRQRMNGTSALNDLRKEFLAGKKSSTSPAGPVSRTKKDRRPQKKTPGAANRGAAARKTRRPPTKKVSFELRDYAQTEDLYFDDDGCLHTGRTNKEGEEVIFVPNSKFAWYRPSAGYGDEILPEPPLRAKPQEQVARDLVYGYPPYLGDRNVPFDSDKPFRKEDVETERAKWETRNDARKRNVPFWQIIPVDELRKLVDDHDFRFGPPAEPPLILLESPRSIREPLFKRQLESTAAAGASAGDDNDNGEERPKKRRRGNYKRNSSSHPSGDRDGDGHDSGGGDDEKKRVEKKNMPGRGKYKDIFVFQKPPGMGMATVDDPDAASAIKPPTLITFDTPITQSTMTTALESEAELRQQQLAPLSIHRPTRLKLTFARGVAIAPKPRPEELPSQDGGGGDQQQTPSEKPPSRAEKTTIMF